MKPDLTQERLYTAVLIGIGGGLLMGRFFGNYPVWVIVFTAIAIAIETSTRVTREGKDAAADQETAVKTYINRLKAPDSIQFKPPKPPKPPKHL